MNLQILAKLGLDEIVFEPGTVVLREGDLTKKVYVLISGKAVIKAKEKQLAIVDCPGTILGEIGALLGTAPVATVTTVDRSSFYVVNDFMAFLEQHPDACVSVAQVLACRLVNMNNHMVHIKGLIKDLQDGLEDYLPVFPENPNR